MKNAPVLPHFHKHDKVTLKVMIGGERTIVGTVQRYDGNRAMLIVISDERGAIEYMFGLGDILAVEKHEVPSKVDRQKSSSN